MDRAGDAAPSSGSPVREGIRPQVGASDAVQRQQIADATCRVISRGGLDDATFRRIAAEIGATTGLINHYFASKADLLGYAINYAQERLVEQGLHQSWSTKEELFDDLCRAITASSDEDGVFWRVWIMFLGVALSDDEVRLKYLAWDGHYRREILALVRKELGETADEDQAQLIADILNALGTGVGIHAILDPEHLDSVRVRRILEHSFEGIIAAARATKNTSKARTRTRSSK